MFRNFLSNRFFRSSASKLAKQNSQAYYQCSKVQEKSLFFNKPYYTFSTLSLLKESALQESLLTQERITQHLQRIDNIPWEDTVKFVRYASSQYDQARSAELKPLFDAVEQRFLKGKDAVSRPTDALDLAIAFAVHKQGSKRFWAALGQRFSFYYQSKRINLAQVASFVYAFSRVGHGDTIFWDRIERDILEAGSVVLSCNVIASLMPALLVSHRNQYNPIEVSVESINDDLSANIENNQLWTIFKDLGMRKVQNMSFYSLYNFGWTQIAQKNKDEGFWLNFEERFNEIAYRLSSIQIANIVYVVGSAKKGTKTFWENVENYVLNCIDSLQPEEIKEFILGFACAEEGSLKLWETLQNYIISSNTVFTPSSIAKISVGLAKYEIAKQRVWDSLEDRAIPLVSQATIEDLVGIICGFGRARKGDEKFWNTIEETVLNHEDLSKTGKLGLYMALKAANKLTSKLSAYFQEVADIGDRLLDRDQELGGEEGRSNSNFNQSRPF